MYFLAADSSLLPVETAVFTPPAANAAVSTTVLSAPSAPSSSQLSLAAALSSIARPPADISLGRGIPNLPKKVVEKMLNWEFVDFHELPPARASTKAATSLASNVLLVQTMDSVPNASSFPT